MTKPGSLLVNGDDVINVVLEDEARTLSTALEDVRKSTDYSFLIQPSRTTPTDAAGWWQGSRSFPAEHRYIQHLVQAGHQPIFCGLSLYLKGSTPTLELPVPYALHQEGLEGFKQAVWLNAPGTENALSTEVDIEEPKPDEWEALFRVYSHAIANIPYSVRVGDKPIHGWLARAHAERSSIYIPDVSKVENREEVRTAAKREERFLGMASVLYIPLYTQKLLPAIEVGTYSYAQAVVMLWSPVLDRWDYLKDRHFTSLREADGSVFESHDFESIPKLSNRLRRLGGTIAKDRLSQYRLQQQAITIYKTQKSLAYRDGQAGMRAFQRLWHGVLDLDEAFNPEAQSGTLSELLWHITHHQNGIIPKIYPDINNRPVYIRLSILKNRQEADYETNKWKHWTTDTDRDARRSILVCKSDEWSQTRIRVSLEFAVSVLGEPISDIAKHAEKLTEVEAIISSRYVTIRYHEKPTKDALDRLIGSRSSFLRYLSIRRGIAAPYLDKTHFAQPLKGVGFMLHNAVGASEGVYRRLYVSPDGRSSSGAHAYVEIALPLQKDA